MQHQAVVGVPEEDLDNPALMIELAISAKSELMRIHGRPIRLTLSTWYLADADEVDSVPHPKDPDFDGPCPSCRAGRDQAKAYLRNHPGHLVAIGFIDFEWV